MYCPKCATKNPDNGRYCRKCGMGLPRESADGKQFEFEEQVKDELAPRSSSSPRKAETEKEAVGTWESATVFLGSGLAFTIISIVLAFQPMGHGWWFWMLIPGFAVLGLGIAQVIRLRQLERQDIRFSEGVREREVAGSERVALPPNNTGFAEEEVKGPARSGEFAPPSVTEGTTRHLEIEHEADTT